MRRIFQNMRFMVLWIIGCLFALYTSLIGAVIISIGSGVAAALIWAARNREPGMIGWLVFSIIVYSLVGLIIGTLVGLLQKGALRQHTAEYWHGWLLATIAGAVIGVNVACLLLSQQLAAHINLLELPTKENFLLYLMELVVIPLGCIGLAQMPVLWRYVYGAWVWVLANIVAGIVLVALLVAFISVTVSGNAWAVVYPIFGVLFASVAPGIVTGFAMIWLLLFNGKGDYPA